MDSVAGDLMGFDGRQLVYLRIAAEAQLGTNDLAGLRLYTVKDGSTVPCWDLEALRAEPPFQAISNIVGEKSR